MEASQDKSTLLTRAIGVAFGLGTQASFAVTVWFLFWFLRDSDSQQSRSWLVVDVLLALQFAVVHSTLLLPSVRRWISGWLPSPLYGSLFCVITCVGLWLMFYFWRGSPTVVWNATGTGLQAVRGAFYFSWVALFYSLSLSGFGYQTGWTQWLIWLRRKPLPFRGLVDRGLYRWLRHPVYLSFLGLIWFTPRMTTDRLLLAGIWSVYIFVGSNLKDRRMAYYLGDTYREYASRVAGYPGIFFGPLGKWPHFDNARATTAVNPQRIESHLAA